MSKQSTPQQFTLHQTGATPWHRVRSLPEAAEVRSALAGLTRDGREIARRMVRSLTPLRTMVQRNTRDLLRKYQERGILKERICRRDPKLVWIPFTVEEERL